jgi:hypothetical protein
MYKIVRRAVILLRRIKAGIAKSAMTRVRRALRSSPALKAPAAEYPFQCHAELVEACESLCMSHPSTGSG